MRIKNYKTGKTSFQKLRKRYDLPGQARELTFSCFRRYAFLSRDRTREWFVEAMQNKRADWPIDLWAWVIMPEHVHLLVYPRELGVKVGRFQGAIKEQVGRKAVSWLKQDAPEWLPKITVREGKRVRRRFWQPGGGYDRNVIELATAHKSIDYIHANPVRRGLVTRPEDWKWSSARWYAECKPVLIEMDRTIPMHVE